MMIMIIIMISDDDDDDYDEDCVRQQSRKSKCLCPGGRGL